jgi:hypothetical protein
MKKPNLFIVGKQKSGTTALYDMLKQHPKIFLSSPKEPNFFAKDFHRKKENFRDKKEYLKLFAKVNDEKIIGEASSNNLYSEVAVKGIKKFNPDAKIIILLREPVEFLRSLYQELFHVEQAKNLKEALELEDIRKEGHKIKTKIQIIPTLFYSKRVKYARQVKRFVDNFPNKNIKVIIFEDFKKDNLKTYKEICEFLGVGGDFRPEIRKKNAAKKRKLKRIWFFLDQRGITLASIKKFLPKKVWRFGKFLFKKEGKERIDKKFREELMKKFKPEVVKINDLLHEENLIEREKDLVKFWGYDKID